MKITIIAGGSRGDVQPYVALGHGLQQAGHQVQLLASLDFQSLITAYGLTFVALSGVQRAQIEKEMQAITERGNLLEILAKTGQGAKIMARESATSGLTACQGSDLILGGLGGLFVGLALSEKLGIPLVQAHLMPFHATREFASVLLPVPRWANGVSHQLTQLLLWQMFREADNEVRTQVLGLPAASFFGPYASLARQTRTILYGYSPHVIPAPSDWASATPALHVTGYWFLDAPADWKPPADLVAFLEQGPPPVYIGFGSMLSRSPEATADLVLQALARTGQRGVLAAGWGGLKKENLPKNVFMLEAIPHSWLFPRMAAVVHHGGAGTTAAGLWAGVPSIVTPFFGDQPFWGRRVHKLGVGPKPIPRQQLTAHNLAEAIGQATSDKTMQQQAAALGQRIQAEDGIARAVALIGAQR